MHYRKSQEEPKAGLKKFPKQACAKSKKSVANAPTTLKLASGSPEENSAQSW
jgi:hypothetical protein